MKLNFIDRFSKNTQISNFMKLLSLGAQLFHGDGRKNGQTYRQTDRQTHRHDKSNSSFLQFCESTQKLSISFRENIPPSFYFCYPVVLEVTRNKLPPAQLVSAVSLIWQRVSTSLGHLQSCR